MEKNFVKLNFQMLKTLRNLVIFRVALVALCYDSSMYFLWLKFWYLVLHFWCFFFVFDFNSEMRRLKKNNNGLINWIFIKLNGRVCYFSNRCMKSIEIDGKWRIGMEDCVGMESPTFHQKVPRKLTKSFKFYCYIWSSLCFK